VQFKRCRIVGIVDANYKSFSCAPFFQVLASLSGRNELRDCYGATFTHAAPVELDSRDFMKSVGREVTGAAMWATNDRHPLDYEQSGATSIAAGYWPNLNASAPTIFTEILPPVILHRQ
jgi:hypothetical protein